MIVVANATPLIGLTRIGRLAVLKDLFGSVLVPRAVNDEVVTDAPDRPGASEVHQADWIKVFSVIDRTKVDYRRSDLDPGEAEVLVLAEERNADIG